MNSTIAFVVLLFSGAVQAQSYSPPADAADSYALKQTQDLLQDKTSRNKFIKSDANAQKADAYAKELSGSEESTNALYEISSKILPLLAEQNNNDPEKMKAQLQKALQDPQKFYDSLPADLKKEIGSASSVIEKRRSPAQNTPR